MSGAVFGGPPRPAGCSTIGASGQRDLPGCPRSHHQPAVDENPDETDACSQDRLDGIAHGTNGRFFSGLF
jgi:hypothetical protein